MPATPELQRGKKEDQEFKLTLSKLKTSWVYTRLALSNVKTQKRLATGGLHDLGHAL